MAATPVVDRLAWTRSLPAAYLPAIAGAVLFVALNIADQYLALDSAKAIGDVACAALIFSAPLRAAWQRGDDRLGPVGVIAATLLVATLTVPVELATPPELGAFLAATVMGAMAVLLLRHFEVRPPTFTFVLGVQGILATGAGPNRFLALASLATGVIADLLVIVIRPSRDRDAALRAFAVVVPALFVVLHLVATSASAGAVVAAGVSGWLASYLVFPGRQADDDDPGERSELVLGMRLEDVRDVLLWLDKPSRLAKSRLVGLPMLAGNRNRRAAELRELVVDIVRELAAFGDGGDAEAGKALLELYIRNAGSEDEVAQRLGVSRRTATRLVHRGLALVAGRLDELSEEPAAVAP